MKIKTAVTLPEDLVEKLDEYAAERGLPRRDIIIEAIEDYLEPLFEGGAE